MADTRISLDQWRALAAVVDAGGYAQAAERLHKTQSTVSYAVQKIESQLGVELFSLEGRKAVLTEAGRVLYRRGRALLEEAARVERCALNLASGWEAELRLAMEILFPTWLLLDCMARFAQERPDIRIELYESVLGGTDELLLEGRVNMAVCSQVPPGFLGDPLMQVKLVAAAAPEHPLHRLGRDLNLDDLRGHRHLVVRDSGMARSRPGAWEGAEQRWTVSHKATSIQAACMGLGFAWYGEDTIRPELESGRLKPLPLAEGAERWVTLYLVYADPGATGPGVLRLGDLIRAGAAQCPHGLKKSEAKQNGRD